MRFVDIHRRVSTLLRVTFLFVVLSTLSCNQDNPKANIPDVSHIAVQLETIRFDSLLFPADTSRIPQAVQAAVTQHPAFVEIYAGLLRDNEHLKLSPAALLTDFAGSPIIRKLQDTCWQVYGDISNIQTDLQQAFRYQKYYFPHRPVPALYTFISEYTMGTFTYGDSILAIGLDFYLGADYPQYDPVSFPHYIKRMMSRPYIVPKAIEAVANNIVGQTTNKNLLEHVIANGKILYIMSKLLPETPDSLLLGYTQKQVDWCTKNEKQMWAYFLSDNLLYSNNYTDFRKYIDHSPNAPGMPPEAPGRVGNWLGWQIISAYMQRYPNTTLPQLLALRDAQKLLEQSKYKPRR